MQLQDLPVTYQATIPEDYLDEMGHMNVMWYTHLFGCATMGLFERIGLTRAYFEAHQTGSFALEHHVRYLAEVRVGQQVTLRSRALDRSAKRLHFMNFMVHADGRLAATGEFIGTHMDMKVRRSSPLPPHIAEAFDRLAAEHQKLSWAAPVCGVMKP